MVIYFNIIKDKIYVEKVKKKTQNKTTKTVQCLTEEKHSIKYVYEPTDDRNHIHIG